jgi:hypothetical protein
MDRKFVYRIIFVCLTLFVFSGCSGSNPTQPPTSTNQSASPNEVITRTVPTPAETPIQVSVSEETLKNMSYSLDIVREAIPGSDGTAQLKNGKFEYQYPNSASGVQVLYEQNATGDLNADNIPDAAVLLAVSSGGSGTFQTLAAVIDENGRLKQSAATLLGDRVKIQDMQIKDGQIIVNMLVQGPDDPMCCPTQPKQVIFQLQNNQLIEQNP